MDILNNIVHNILHLDEFLTVFVADYGTLTYLILFFIIFMETGFVVTPFLPGDSLLFAVGALSALNVFKLPVALFLLFLAAVLGDTVNYWIGKWIGLKVFEKDYRFIKKKYLVKTQDFFEKHGGKTIILARFVPIVRTFAPFVAGIGTMHYQTFLMFNIVGAALWVTLFTLTGFFFGNIPAIKQNFELAVFAIIGISLIPIAIEFIRSKRNTEEKVTEKDIEETKKELKKSRKI